VILWVGLEPDNPAVSDWSPTHIASTQVNLWVGLEPDNPARVGLKSDPQAVGP
jgi:hypothetical protein